MRRTIPLLGMVLVISACSSASPTTTTTTAATTTTTTTTTAATTTTTTTTTTAPSTTTSTTVPEASFDVPDGWLAYGSVDSGFRVALPAEWVDVAELLEDPEAWDGIFEGTELEGMEEMVLEIQQNQGELLMLNPSNSTLEMSENLNLIVAEQGLGETIDTVRTAASVGLEAVGATGVTISDTSTAAHTGVLVIEYQMPEFGVAQALQYVFLVSGRFWILTFTGIPASDPELWNQIAGTFVVTE